MPRRSPVRLEVGGHFPHAGWYVDLIVVGRVFSVTTYEPDLTRWGVWLGGNGVVPSVVLNGYGLAISTHHAAPTLKSLNADVRFLGEELRRLRAQMDDFGPSIARAIRVP